MDDLKKKVQDALAAAAENGYEFEGMDARAIAVDMLTFCSELEDEDLDELAHMVMELRGKL